jgi:hypothetical protein
MGRAHGRTQGTSGGGKEARCHGFRGWSEEVTGDGPERLRPAGDGRDEP